MWTLLMFFFCATPVETVKSQPLQKNIVGYWRCTSGPCLDDSVELAIEEGVHVYRSWLHQRPSCSEGTWALNGSSIRITCHNELIFIGKVVRAEKDRLILREAKAPDSAAYRRMKP
jgi:hypothetical protein